MAIVELPEEVHVKAKKDKTKKTKKFSDPPKDSTLETVKKVSFFLA